MYKKVLIGLIILTLSEGANAQGELSINPFHPIRSVEKNLIIAGVIGLAGYATYEYLITHPDNLSNFITTHPDQIIPLKNYIEKKKETAKTQAQYNKYNNFETQLNLNINALQAEITLEQNQDWKNLYSQVEISITQVKQELVQEDKTPNACNIAIVSQLLMPAIEFENNINQNLPKNQSPVTQILDVNTFRMLKNKYTVKTIKQNQDHIPSYAAIKNFLNNHGIKTRDRNLENNETAIATPEEIHMLGRTYAGKNQSPLVTIDAKNLLVATMKDITTTAYEFYKNPQYNITAQDYVKSAMFIYARNKMLCLYDVK